MTHASYHLDSSVSRDVGDVTSGHRQTGSRNYSPASTDRDGQFGPGTASAPIVRERGDNLSVGDARLRTGINLLVKAESNPLVGVAIFHCILVKFQRTCDFSTSLTLDLSSFRIQMDALGHALMSFCSVCRQFFGFIPDDVHVLQISSDDVHPIFPWAFRLSTSTPTTYDGGPVGTGCTWKDRRQ